MYLFARPAHKAVARMVGYALTLGTVDGFFDLSEVLALRLTPIERASLAYAAMRNLDRESAGMFGELFCAREELPPASEAMIAAAVEYRRARDPGARA